MSPKGGSQISCSSWWWVWSTGDQVGNLKLICLQMEVWRGWCEVLAQRWCKANAEPLQSRKRMVAWWIKIAQLAGRFWKPVRSARLFGRGDARLVKRVGKLGDSAWVTHRGESIAAPIKSLSTPKVFSLNDSSDEDAKWSDCVARRKVFGKPMSINKRVTPNYITRTHRRRA